MSGNPRVRQVVDADRRLVILRLLVEYRGALNSSTLLEGVRAWDHRYVDRPMLLDDLHWLEFRDLVTLDDLGSNVLDAAITPKGERAAGGNEWVEDVARPDKG
jgi:hypothetical protein